MSENCAACPDPLTCAMVQGCQLESSPSETEPTRQPVGGEAGEVVRWLTPVMTGHGVQLSGQQASKAAALIEAQERHLQEEIAQRERDAQNWLDWQSERDELRRRLQSATDDYLKLKDKLDELRRRLETPCEEVMRWSHAFRGMLATPATGDYVSFADYRDLYRKWQEAQAEIKEMIASEELSMQRAEAAEQRAAEAVAREREACAELAECDECDQTEYNCHTVTRIAAAIRARSEGGGNG